MKINLNIAILSRGLWVPPLAFLLMSGCGGGGGGAATTCPPDDSCVSTSKVTYAYVGSRNTPKIYSYQLGPNGTLTTLSTITTNGLNYDFAVTSDNQYFYSLNGYGSMDQFKILSDGSLAPLSPQTIPLSNGTYAIAISKDDKYLFAPSFDKRIYQFVINANGTLTPNSVPFVASGKGPVIIKRSLDGNYMYVSNTDDATIQSYSVGADGQLSLNGPAVPTNPEPWGITFSNDGKNLYVCTRDSVICQFSIGSNGQLTANGKVPCPTHGSSISTSPTDGFIFCSAYGGVGEIARYSVNSDGTLKEITPRLNTNSDPDLYPLVFSPDNVMYVGHQNSDKVNVYCISKAATIRPQQVAVAGTIPSCITFVKK